ncbi:HAD family phosphatase [Candidatus Peregrinibacteria bacterium]|jgi:HAD superfamily hydrolase (TIGR01509 family)|nr:HAD family phosphatase [Candidatus Peregrinibacteria bacterium]MBT4632254.1 HAD family phosphatase [Candidatus Peregrinibacteria bacterium]MBT5516650.1 HAD family phosphatase [Candidatus Peregrinibacteria bacterium]MBT5824335.1 HAD family phosphatase [Candidatus Peregrinibacteria bacterium]
MKFKTIFWDNDGTLVNTEPLYFKATQQVLATIGIDLTRDWYINVQLKKGLSAFDLAFEKGLNETEVQALRNKRNEIYMHLLQIDSPVIDHVIPTLEKLRGKIPMGVVTSSHRDHFETIMKASDLKKYFDFTICNDDVIKDKPNPEPYLKAWEQSGFKKEECLVIEDTERGVTAAKAAGLTCFACPTELSSTNDFSNADKQINNVSEILDYFDV